MPLQLVIEPFNYEKRGRVKFNRGKKDAEVFFYEGYRIKAFNSDFMLGFGSHEKRVERVKDLSLNLYYPLLTIQENHGIKVCFPNYSFYVPYIDVRSVKEVVEKIREKIIYSPKILENAKYPLMPSRLSQAQREIVGLLMEQPICMETRRLRLIHAEDYVKGIIERLKRKGRYFAEWYEIKTFQNLKHQQVNLLAHGNVSKMKTGFISRFLASAFLPKWEVLAAVLVTDEEVTLEHLISIIQSARSYITEKKIKWCWLNIVSTKNISWKASAYLEDYMVNNLGIVLTDLKNEKAWINPVIAGKWAVGIFNPKIKVKK